MRRGPTADGCAIERAQCAAADRCADCLMESGPFSPLEFRFESAAFVPAGPAQIRDALVDSEISRSVGTPHQVPRRPRAVAALGQGAKDLILRMATVLVRGHVVADSACREPGNGIAQRLDDCSNSIRFTQPSKCFGSPSETEQVEKITNRAPTTSTTASSRDINEAVD